MSHFLASGMHWQLINFSLFVVILYFSLRKAVSEFWQSRSHSISFAMEEAMRGRKEAGRQVFELENRIGKLNEEIQNLVRFLREEGELGKKRMVEEARRHSEKIMKDAEGIMRQEVRKTKEILKRQLVETSMEMSRSLIQEKMNVQDHRRLEGAFFERLEGRL